MYLSKNNEDPDQPPYYAASDLGLHCLPMSHDVRLKYVIKLTIEKRYFIVFCSILMKPVMNSSNAWQSAAKDIEELADCLKAYRDYLAEQNKTAKHNQRQTH